MLQKIVTSNKPGQAACLADIEPTKYLRGTQYF